MFVLIYCTSLLLFAFPLLKQLLLVFCYCNLQVRTGYFEGKNRIDSLISDIGNWGASAVTIHGRTRQQRYSKLADWDYVYQCARKAPTSLQVLGNGDVFSYLDWNKHKAECPELSALMIARGALVKVHGHIYICENFNLQYHHAWQFLV